MSALLKRSHGWSYSLRETYCEKLHADVTLICEGRKLLVHRSVLASLSPFFKKLLRSKDLSEPVISMEGYKYSILALLVDFSYQGYVNGSQDQLLILFDYAKDLRVEGLVNSSQNTKPVISDLIDTRSAAKLELKKLQTIDSDSDSCSSDDEDISILYENLERDKRPATVTQAINEKDKKTKPNIIPPNQIGNTINSTTSSNSMVQLNEKRQSDAGNPRKKLKLNSSTPVPEPKPTQQVTKEPVQKPIKCSVCKQIFLLKHELRVHLTLHHAEILTCRICDKIFQSQVTLKRHLHKHIEKLDVMISAAGASL